MNLRPLAPLLLLAACAEAPATEDSAASGSTYVEVTQVALVPGFDGPESVRYDELQDVYFVSNFTGNPNELDNTGFISRVTADGVVDSLKFIAGGQNGVTLHGPRGMTIVADTLWAADADAVRGFDRNTGEPVGEIPFAAFEPGFLNDVTAGPDGELYVTDTGRNRVYRVDGRAVTIALEGDELNSPNGITWDRTQGHAVLLPFGGNQLLNSWDGESRDLSPVATGLPGGRYDGVEVLGPGQLMVSSQADSSIHIVQDGRAVTSLKTLGAPADVGYDVRRHRVAVPFVARNEVQILALP